MANEPKLKLNRIKAVLAEQNKTGRWLAGQLGKGENIISRWCSNKIQPSLEQLAKIAEILQVDARTLIRPNGGLNQSATNTIF